MSAVIHGYKAQSQRFVEHKAEPTSTLRRQSEALLSVRNLRKSYGGLVATANVDLDVREGEVHAVLGPNGAGKTTLLGQLTGQVRPDAGHVFFDGHDITRLPVHARARKGIGRSFQITSVFPDLSVLENVALAVQVSQGHSFRFWSNAMGAANLREPAQKLLERVGLAQHASMQAGTLSHGQHRQLEIAISLAGRPRLLLLDEPMAGMGSEDSSDMVKLLKSLKGQVSMLLVEHDVEAVFALADRISVLVYGKCIATGTPEEIRGNAAVRVAYLGISEGDA